MDLKHRIKSSPLRLRSSADQHGQFNILIKNYNRQIFPTEKPIEKYETPRSPIQKTEQLDLKLTVEPQHNDMGTKALNDRMLQLTNQQQTNFQTQQNVQTNFHILKERFMCLQQNNRTFAKELRDFEAEIQKQNEQQGAIRRINKQIEDFKQKAEDFESVLQPLQLKFDKRKLTELKSALSQFQSQNGFQISEIQREIVALAEKIKQKSAIVDNSKILELTTRVQEVLKESLK